MTSQIAAVCAPLAAAAGSGFYQVAVGGAGASAAAAGAEVLAANDALAYVDGAVATVVGLPAAELVRSLPHVQKGDRVWAIHAVLEQDYAPVVACKDLGFTVLISHSVKEQVDFAIVAQLLAAKGSSVIHFYHELSEEEKSAQQFELYAAETVAQLAESFEGSNVDDALAHVQPLVGQLYTPFALATPRGWFGTRASTVGVLLGKPDFPAAGLSDIAILAVKIFRPFNNDELVKSIGEISNVERVVFIEQSSATLQYQSLFLSALDSITALVSQGLKISTVHLLKVVDSADVYGQIVANAAAEDSKNNLVLGEPFVGVSSSVQVDSTPEGSYLRVLRESQSQLLTILNDFQSNNASPAYSFGKFLAHDEHLQKLVKLVESELKSFQGELNSQLSAWLVLAKESSETFDATKLIAQLESNSSAASNEILALKEYLHLQTQWIVGTDSWAFDTGLSAFHEVLKSKNNRVKLLIIDSDSSVNIKQGKKNLGLYAINYGGAYVASVALYSSYTQTLTAFLEANKYGKGPAIVLAYMPKAQNYLDMLKETKKAVDTGYWPLYRYDPTKADDETFQLDSSFIKRELQQFLERENRLSLLVSKSAKLEYNLQSYNQSVQTKTTEKAKDAFQDLLDNLAGEPITIAFASDGGNATNVAKKFATRAANKGLKVKSLAMDDLSIEDLSLETNVVFITSTSGQGEFPTNGKQFWDAIKGSTVDLGTVRVAVFGLGDSKYWPRKEDAHYYNKPAQDLYKKLTTLGAVELAPLGLGDDQGDDGYNTGYNEWEPKVWESLGVSLDNGDEPAPITNEDIKIGSNYLRGTIKEGLLDPSTGAISASDQQLTKFHGIYMQDDRDIRDERKQQGMEPAYSFMVRVRLPGGVTSADQWLKIDELASTKGNDTVKITTRATYQLHGVVKKDLKEAIKEINTTAMDTLGACGDVNRNVMISALPHNRHLHSQMVHTSKVISARLLPETTAYHDIWLTDLGEVARGIEGAPKKMQVGGEALQDHEPLYGATYLPRKFKVVIAMPPYNDVDAYAHDVGLISIVENNDIIGYNVLVGGGMGTTHNNSKTYPRTGSMFGFVPYDKVSEVCEKIMLVQRDNGDRKNRKHARLKYTVDDMTVEGYKAAVEALLGWKFSEPKHFQIDSNIDFFGWTQDETGLNHYTCFIENGRVEDVAGKPQKTGLKKIAEYFKEHNAGCFRLTGNQHVLLSDIPDEHLDAIKELMKEHNLDNLDHSSLRLSSASCVAFPTCGLAMAEAERYLPVLIGQLEEELEKLGLRNDSIVMRMTGCPNGCARPWVAEVALVGKSYGYYNIMLGGSYIGSRVNKIYKTNVNETEVVSTLVPLFARWAKERLEGEHFGDFCVRAGIIVETKEGKYFWDDVAEDA